MANEVEAEVEMQRTGVLFMQSQEFFGADSQIHGSVMRHLPRDRFEVHCAVPVERDDAEIPSLRAVRSIPDVVLRPIDFGPSFEAVEPRDARRLLLRRGPRVAWDLLRLSWYIRRNRIKIVHCTEKPRDAVLGRLVARLGGANCVIHVHVKAASWLRPQVQRSMSRADALIGVSEFVAESIREFVGEDAPVHAVLNGLEIDDWVAPEVPPEEVRRQFGFGPDTPVIVSASRLFRHKGQHQLLAALPVVRESFPDVRLLIVGTEDPRAAPGEDSYFELLRSMVDELELDENVIFTGWRTDVRELMAASDIYAMPSFEEPFGMVFIEAMHLGKPVVALDNGGTREVVENGRTGLLSPPDDLPALEQNLIRLLADGDLRARMGRAGQARVETFLTAQRMADDVADVYATLC